HGTPGRRGRDRLDLLVPACKQQGELGAFRTSDHRDAICVDPRVLRRLDDRRVNAFEGYPVELRRGALPAEVAYREKGIALLDEARPDVADTACGECVAAFGTAEAHDQRLVAVLPGVQDRIDLAVILGER